MKESSLYIHIPFCMKKCRYCDFPSFSNKEFLMDDYIDALNAELNSVKEKYIFDTIFIGGGTPTYLSLEAWKRMEKSLVELRKNKDYEFTVECNPGTADYEKLEFLKKTGVNRLSIGLQAWQNCQLKELGRIHRLEEFLETYKSARAAGFENINIDIMFGLPDQTLEQWEETLKEVVGLKPEHISCYSLIVEEGTPFYELHKKNKLILPEEEVERKMYDTTLELLGINNYKQYEISNFALPGKECRHNKVYWSLGEYVGCGAAAHSYIKGVRYRNTENIENYIRMIRESNNAIVETKVNSTKDEMEEFMFMGLRMTEGISALEFQRRFGESIDGTYGDVLLKYISKGLIIRKEEKIYLSKKGIEFSNTVMSDFIID